MEHTFKKPRFTRLASLLLALAMVLSMFPVTAFAVERSLTITNVAGEETDTFVEGEAIMVTAVSDATDAWVGIYKINDKPAAAADGGQTSYYYYTVADLKDEETGEYLPNNILNSSMNVSNNRDGWEYALPAGDYKIIMFKDGGYTVDQTVEIEIVAATETQTYSMEVEKAEVTSAEPVRVKVTSLDYYDWIAVYSGTVAENTSTSSLSYIGKYLRPYGRNGEWIEVATLAEGNYSIVLMAEDGYDATKVVNVSVTAASEEPEVPTEPAKINLNTTDAEGNPKTTFKYGEQIIVNYDADAYTPGEKDWIGIYKANETPGAENVYSIYWNWAKAMNGKNMVDAGNLDEGSRSRTDFVPGETYVIYLLENNGYNVLDSVEITVTGEFVDELVSLAPANCTDNSVTTYYYHNGVADEMVYDTVEGDDALGHDYEGVTPEYIRGERKHTYACKNECDEPKVEGCTPDEGRIVSEATNEDPGIKAFTCTVCKGVWEEYYYLDKVETGREVVKEPTCFEQGQWKVYWKDPETGEALEPTFEPIFIVDCVFTKYECDAENLQHQLVCKWCGNTGSGSDITACSDATPEIDTNPKNNCYNYECVCGNTWSESVIILEDDDGIYHLNDLVKVKLNKAYTYSTGKQWIGLYKATEVPSESKAMWFQYLSDVMKGEVNPNGNPYGYFDISQKHYPEAERDLAGYGVGKYQIYLSNTGDYDDAAVMYFEVVACKYDQKVEAPEFLKGSAATCQKGATYYYSCTCGAVDKSASAQTFEGAVNPENHEKTAGWTATAEGHQKTYACCGATLGDVIPHADTKTKDHKCDECGYEMSKHVDADKNHKCDNGCTVDIGEHKDTNKDHSCDYGCDVIIGKCVDNNTDHKCDYGCSATFGVCEDKDGDGKCDYGCDKKYETDATEPDATEPDATEPDATEPDATEPEAPKVEGVDRVAGDDRFKTAVEVADQMKEVLGVEKFQTIIVASGATYADALPGSYLAIVKNAPILLGHTKDKYNTLAQEYIKANLAEGGTVYILGGTSAVPASFEAGLGNVKVERLAGANRFETNMLILEAAGVKEGDEIMVCTGADYADALSASAAGKPILLVHKKLYDYQVKFLEGLKNNTFCVIGGEKAVLPAIEEAVSAYGKTERLAGKDRMLTSHMVAERYFDGSESAVVAYGWNFPDGLCGGPLANALKSPLILTHSKEKLYNVTAEFAKDAGIKTGLILGGDALIPDAAINAIYGTTPVALG